MIHYYDYICVCVPLQVSHRGVLPRECCQWGAPKSFRILSRRSHRAAYHCWLYMRWCVVMLPNGPTSSIQLSLADVSDLSTFSSNQYQPNTTSLTVEKAHENPTLPLEEDDLEEESSQACPQSRTEAGMLLVSDSQQPVDRGDN